MAAMSALINLVRLIYQHRQWLLMAWAALTIWLIYVTVFYVAVIPFVPTCHDADGNVEPLSGNIEYSFSGELGLYFAPMYWERRRVYGPDGNRSHRNAKYVTSYFISPWDALDLRDQTSRATLSVAYSMWYGLSDEDRAKAPEPGNSNLSECEVIRLYAMEGVDRSWNQCSSGCIRYPNQYDE
jgi:hypothetical protein